MLQLFEHVRRAKSAGNTCFNHKWDFEYEIWDERHISILLVYFSNLSSSCHFPQLPSAQLLLTGGQWEPQMLHSFKQELKEIFLVPKSRQTPLNPISRFHLLEAFLSLLLQLLYHQTHLLAVDPLERGIDNLERELRFLHTILGDISWNDLQAEFLNLLPQFEAVANQAGSFVHYLYFSGDRSFRKTQEGVAAVLKHTHFLKVNLKSSIRSSAYATPTTAIVDSILILHSVVDDLEDLLKREDDPLADVKDQVTLLHQELLLSIKHMMRSPSQPLEVKEPLMRIGGIAHQTDYLITSFLVKDAPLWYVFNRLNHLTYMIQPIRTKLQLVTLRYQFGASKVENYHLRAEALLQDKRNTEVNEVTVGFEDKTTDILYQLVGGATQSLQVISILGMPGLGKTTLAKNLYNHPLVNYRFDKLSWCVVSQTYNRQTILANILIHINSELGKDTILNMEEISLVEHIHKTLIRRRYLIVLDDVWDSNVLDELLICFPDDGNGSRILVTSRNKDVAPPNSIIHELPFLTGEQCWELLRTKVFGIRTCPPELHRIGKKIAAKCCGLPLTVVVIAGVLSTVGEEVSTWEEVSGSLAKYIDGEKNSVMQILELSYKHLPDHLKPCFLYFGVFREDEEISVGKLMRLWVAEGFTRKENEKSAENIAEEYLLELIDKSLVMVAKRRIDGRGVKACVVHDLLRDLCIKISKEENFLKDWNIDYHTVYEKGHRVRAFRKTTTLSYCQHVRSFVGDWQSSSLYVRDMRLLRVLYFTGFYGCNRRSFGIEYLVNLRFLVIQNLPTWIDRLVNLEYLRVVSRATAYLPPTIMKMKKLRYLCAKSKYSKDWNISDQTNKLEYLSGVIIKKVKDEELLKCSPLLRKLKCIYSTRRGIEKRADYPHFDLSFLTQLDSLSLSGKLRQEDFGFPLNIRKLTLKGSSLPREKMSIIGRLEFLEVLKLESYSFEGERWDTRNNEFQNLRFLQLQYIQLSEWNVASSEHFPRLQQLILSGCMNLRGIPGEIGEITTLELIEVKGHCLKSLVESAERIKEKQREMGNEDLRVITVSNWF